MADRYTVVGAIGSGGMGGVYEIRGDVLRNRLALKMLRADLVAHATLLTRFEQEARVQAALQHPAIAKVFALVRVDDRAGIVMEFIDGQTLRDWLSGGRADPDTAYSIVEDLLGALSAAHKAGVVHRDIKPENIFVIPDEVRGVRCKVIDFGIAKLSEDALTTRADSTLTQGRDFVGTYRYASPEQVERSGGVDARSDLYSLGVVLWELLAGTSPYPPAMTPFRVQVAVVQEPLPSLPDDVPSELRRLVEELTRKDPQERPQTAMEALALLDAPSGAAETVVPGAAPVQLTPPPPPSRVAPTVVQVATPEPGRSLEAPVRGQLPPRAPLGDRAIGFLIDQIAPWACVLSCVGAPAHPVLIMRRGESQPSWGQRMVLTRVYDLATGEPATRNKVRQRNAVDLVCFHGPLALAAWPVVLVTLPPLSVLLFFWCVAWLTLELVVVHIDNDRRRIADRPCGTMVCEAR